MLRLDTDPQPNKFVRTEAIDYRPKAVLPAVGALRPDTDLAERQCQIVRYHYQPLAASLLFLEQALHGLAAQVHIGLRLGQLDRSASDLDPPDQGPALGTLDLTAVFSRQQIDEHEPEIVPRLFVIGTGITEANDKPVIHRGPELLLAAFGRSFSALFADNSRLCTFFDLRLELNFLDDRDRSDDRLGCFVNFDTFAYL